MATEYSEVRDVKKNYFLYGFDFEMMQDRVETINTGLLPI